MQKMMWRHTQHTVFEEATHTHTRFQNFLMWWHAKVACFWFEGNGLIKNPVCHIWAKKTWPEPLWTVNKASVMDSIVLCIRAQNNIFEFRALIKILLVRDFEKRKEGRLKSFHGQMKRQSVTSCSIWTGRVGGGLRMGHNGLWCQARSWKELDFCSVGLRNHDLASRLPLHCRILHLKC